MRTKLIILALGAAVLSAATPLGAYAASSSVDQTLTSTSTKLVTASNELCAAFKLPSGCQIKVTTQMTVTEGTSRESLASSSPALHWSWACGTATVQNNISGSIWHDTVNDCYHWNSVSVWLNSNPTCGGGGVGFSVTDSWCGDWNNGGGRPYNYLNFGDNFRVSFIFNGFPIYQDYWDRFNVNDTGGHWQSWGQL